MKLTSSLTAGVLSLALLVTASAQSDPIKFELPQVGGNATQPKAAPAAPAATPAPAAAAPARTFTEAQMMEVFGWLHGARLNLAELEFTAANVEAMARGMQAAAAGRQLNYNQEEGQQISQQLQELLAKKQQAFLEKVRVRNLSDSATFFTKLKEDPTIKELPGSNGLRYKVVTEGKGAVAKPGQVARIHYTGAFINGQVFDTSLQAPEGQTPQPIEALVQDGALIDGMTQALLKMPVGSKWILYIPPHLAYGDEGLPQIGIPPAATLLFEVEVFGVADAPKPPADAKK